MKLINILICSTPKGLEDVASYPNLFAELLGNGWSTDELTKLAGQNFLRGQSWGSSRPQEKRRPASVRGHPQFPNGRSVQLYVQLDMASGRYSLGALTHPQNQRFFLDFHHYQSSKLNERFLYFTLIIQTYLAFQSYMAILQDTDTDIIYNALRVLRQYVDDEKPVKNMLYIYIHIYSKRY